LEVCLALVGNRLLLLSELGLVQVLPKEVIVLQRVEVGVKFVHEGRGRGNVVVEDLLVAHPT